MSRHPFPVMHAPIRARARLSASLSALLLALALAAAPPPARASFHLMEISRVMTGFNGDSTIQAVELRMQIAGQQFVGGTSIKAYDPAGALLGTLGTFGGSVGVGSADRRILCATAAFQDAFGITADLTITPGLLVSHGQVSFEAPTCVVNAIAYGQVTAVKNGPSSAPALYKSLSYALVRTTGNATAPSCPLAEDAAAKMTLRTGSSASPIVFTNNAGASANVFSTVTSVETARPSDGVALSIAPNPVRVGARVTAPARGRLVIHDVGGRLVAVLSGGREGAAGGFDAAWDGRDRGGRRVPSGVYFLRYEGPGGASARRFVVTR